MIAGPTLGDDHTAWKNKGRVLMLCISAMRELYYPVMGVLMYFVLRGIKFQGGRETDEWTVRIHASKLVQFR